MTSRTRWTIIASICLAVTVGVLFTKVVISYDESGTFQSASLLPRFAGTAGSKGGTPRSGTVKSGVPNTSVSAQPIGQPTAALSVPTLKSTAPVTRTFAPDSAWKRMWVVGSDSTSDTWVEPRQLVVNGDMVMVLDDGTREVRGLDKRTGATRLVMLPRGQGPGEFKRPSLLATTPTGFVVLDQANARLTAYDRTGKLEWDAVLTDAVMIRGLCILRGPRVVSYYNRRDSALVNYDSTGRRGTVRSLSWTVTDTAAQGFAYSAYISDGSSGDTCVLAPLFGARWGAITSTGPVRMFALIEPGETAATSTASKVLDRAAGKVVVTRTEISESPQSSRGALIRGDTAIVYAAHTRQFRLRILDYYLLSTGEYLFSRKLPGPFNALTVGNDGTFYGTLVTPSVQVVVAMKPERPGTTLTAQKKSKQ